jgi:hypothetical protein
MGFDPNQCSISIVECLQSDPNDFRNFRNQRVSFPVEAQFILLILLKAILRPTPTIVDLPETPHFLLGNNHHLLRVLILHLHLRPYPDCQSLHPPGQRCDY